MKMKWLNHGEVEKWWLVSGNEGAQCSWWLIGGNEAAQWWRSGNSLVWLCWLNEGEIMTPCLKCLWFNSIDVVAH